MECGIVLDRELSAVNVVYQTMKNKLIDCPSCNREAVMKRGQKMCEGCEESLAEFRADEEERIEQGLRARARRNF